MKENILIIASYVVLIVLAICIYKAIFEAVYYSDMPIWLKYILLK